MTLVKFQSFSSQMKYFKEIVLKPEQSFSGKMIKKIVFSIKAEVEDSSDMNLAKEILPKGLEEKLLQSAQGCVSADEVIESSEPRKYSFCFERRSSHQMHDEGDGNVKPIKQEIFDEDLDYITANLGSPSHSNSGIRLSFNGTVGGPSDSISNRNQHELHTADLKPVKCNLCNKTFAKSSDLLRHNWSHGKEKPHKCQLCDKGFVQKSNLLIHIRSHSEDKPFKCNICDKSFLQKSDLLVHLRVHTKEKPYKCPECDKSFSQISHLQRHKLYHTKEKPFRCDVCDKSFTQKADLFTHHRVHTKEKPFICDVCQIGFTQRANLIRHKRVHVKDKPFKCDICDKGFIQKSDLQIHNRVHTKEKPYECSVCSKGFTQKANLMRHTMTHLKPKPYKCYLCGKEYSDQKSMYRHQRDHANKIIDIQELDTSKSNAPLNSSEETTACECDICDQVFASETELWKHKDENHTTENSYHVVFVGNTF